MPIHDYMRAVAIIPARGGSKRIPRKNIRPFRGRPMIAHTIEAAADSEVFDRVIVSTDDEEIAHVAEVYGAEVPFRRDSALADDETHVSAVTVDALERIDPDGTTYPLVAQLMANCPLRSPSDIVNSLYQFTEEPAETRPRAQLSVFEYGWQNPWWARTMDEEGRLSALFDEESSARSQDLPRLYCITGAIWWARTEVLRNMRTFHVEDPAGWVMPWQRAVDIDTPEDWKFAEMLARFQDEELHQNPS